MYCKEQAMICDSCRRGHVTKRMEEIAFYQWSNIGRIHCRVIVSIGICDVCHVRSVDQGFDSIFDEAFRREYGRAAKSAVGPQASPGPLTTEAAGLG